MATKKKKLSRKQREKDVVEKYEKSVESKETKDRRLREELGSHAADSETWLSTLRDGWDEKEAMLICKLEDSISKEGNVHSQVFDPRLSTIVFERAARVMARNPGGKVFALSKDDLGKSKLMNLLLKYYQKNANSWHSMVVKSRMLDLYSMVYGTMFALVPWNVDTQRNYIGPEMLPLPIRSCYPQPSATSISNSDWFQVSSMKTIDWFKQQAKLSDKWKNIDTLIEKVLGGEKRGSGDIKPSTQNTYVETEWYGSSSYSDLSFPKVELRTEYRKNQWITFAPAYDNLIVRDIKNPYGNGELPIVAKHAWPLMDSIIGLGEFERGKTLQLAVNSLINLYLDGVKYSLFPPVHINPKNVIDTTIKWGPGEKWLMKNPMVDVRQMRLSPQGLSTFQSTYGFLIGALMNQAGTTEVSSPASTSPAMGKTPQAIRMMAGRESARDEWDRTMMEDTLQQVYSKWITMTVKKMEKKVVTRVFGAEAKEIAKNNKDVVEFYDKRNKYATVNISKKSIDAKYDFEIETGSIMRPDLEGEQQNIGAILAMVLKNPMILESIRAKEKDLDIGELFKRWMIAGGIKDYDRIIIESPEAKKEDEARKKKEAEAAAQMARSQMMPPPGMVPQGMVPPGMAPPGMAPQGMPPQGMMSPGMAPPGMAPPGIMPSAAPAGPMMPPGGAPPMAGPPPGPGGQQFSDPDVANTFAAIQSAMQEIRAIPTK